MSGFLYFVTAGRGASRDQLEAAGLAETLWGAEVCAGQIDAGPGGRSGVLIALDRAGAPTLRYSEDGWRWMACEGGRFHLGWRPGKPPTARELERADGVRGHPVRLEDGATWTAPVARVFSTGLAPVVRLGVGADGGCVAGATVDRLRAVEADAARIWGLMLAAAQAQEGEAPAEITLGDEWQIACRALAVNYHVSRWEVGALELLTNVSTLAVTSALVDWPGLLEHAKKNGTAAPPRPSPTSPMNSGAGA